MNNIKHEFVNDEDIPAEHKTYLETLKNEKPNIHAIPDLNILLTNIYDILFYLLSNEGKYLLNTQYDHLIETLGNKYEFVPLSMIKMLANENNRTENVEYILSMISHLQDAKDGIVSIEDVHKNFTDNLNKRYITK
jgi:hypothetical protein